DVRALAANGGDFSERQCRDGGRVWCSGSEPTVRHVPGNADGKQERRRPCEIAYVRLRPASRRNSLAAARDSAMDLQELLLDIAGRDGPRSLPHAVQAFQQE